MEDQNERNKLYIRDYRMDKICFELTNPGVKAEGVFPVNSIFSRRIKKIDEENFEYTLICDVRDIGDSKMPCKFSAEMIGKFSLADWETDMYKFEREILPATVLYPILRAFALNITTNAYMDPPLSMGLVDESAWKTIQTVN